MSNMGAAFRNSCPFPVNVTWCTQGGDCRPGYSNVGMIAANRDWSFSYDAPPSGVTRVVAYAACRSGFVGHQGELSKKLLHACR